MNATALHDRLARPDAPLLLHVLPEDAFAARRIAGSRNACVYETAFLGKVEALAPSRDVAIVVYGAGGASLEAVTAAAKLGVAGYTNVAALEGGLAAWEAAGLPLEGDGHPPAPVLDGTYVLDLDATEIHWTGRSPFNQHRGTLKAARGEVVFKDGAFVTGQVVADMRTIACDDLAGSEWHDHLIHHLESDDFFDVANHPEAVCTLDGLTALDEGTPGKPGHAYLMRGHFTLRGVTRAIDAEATIGTPDGLKATGQAMFALDRTAHGCHYGARKLFSFLGKHVVDELIHLNLKIVATRA